MQMSTNHEANYVAAVCGKEVRIYEPLPKGADRRTLARVLTFPHYGAAKVYAEDFDAHQRGETTKAPA